MPEGGGGVVAGIFSRKPKACSSGVMGGGGGGGSVSELEKFSAVLVSKSTNVQTYSRDTGMFFIRILKQITPGSR